MNTDDFDVSAYFYNKGVLKFRRYLEIKRKSFSGINNDLSIIMMNPGSSKPKDLDEGTNSKFLNKFVTAHPDPTQIQIMKVMEICNFNYAKVINLSDVRSANSNDFYKLLTEKLTNVNHSIFQDINEYYLLNYLNVESKFILAWGVNSKLNTLAKAALNKIGKITSGSTQIFGLSHESNPFGYYHPLPKNKLQQDNWIAQMTLSIKNKHYLKIGS
ncbi:MAG: DUF1643 domain-containing protein [Bacteroidetes bacterium]|nr:DUF1643 domain-containing protein [Bacteroidota bacterium]